MAKSTAGIPQAKWQVTATTVNCDKINDYVTFIVYKDWTCRCTWWAKYKKVADAQPGHKFSRPVKRNISKCDGKDCSFLSVYRDKLIDEEISAKN